MVDPAVTMCAAAAEEKVCVALDTPTVELGLYSRVGFLFNSNPHRS